MTIENTEGFGKGDLLGQGESNGEYVWQCPDGPGAKDPLGRLAVEHPEIKDPYTAIEDE